LRYYCVVEDFVTGAQLEDNKSSSLYYYCKQYSPEKEASYDRIVNFQAEYIFKWIIEFCDIMTHMTNENRILHLDIKPENIMVTRTGSIVLIDMGLSGFMEDQSNVINLQFDYDHIHTDSKNAERRYITVEDKKVVAYVYGTPGFAAPECYYKDGEGCEDNEELKNPFYTGRATEKDGLIDIRSDIFSFGAVLWDIIHLGGYGGDGIHKDYATLQKAETKDGYFKRDLHYASPFYLQDLENIILKCTEEDPDKRYQDYDQLKRAAERAKKRLPNSEENVKRARVLRGVGFASLMISVLFLVVLMQGLWLGYDIALQDFRMAAYSYSEHTNPIGFRDVALRLLDEAASAWEPVEPIYIDILSTVSSNGRISNEEFKEILHRVIDGRDVNDEITTLYINTAMQKAVPGNDTDTLSGTIYLFFQGSESIGYSLAYANYNRGRDTLGSFETLVRYRDMHEFDTVLNRLARNLINEEVVRNNPEYRETTEEIIRETEGRR
jgi:hypothetical protein